MLRALILPAALVLSWGLSSGVAAQPGSPAATADAGPQPSDFVRRPFWTRRPTANDMARLYPPHQRGIEAFVTLECVVGEQGQLSACEIIKESPPGLGFGESTIRLSKLFKMKLTDSDGASVVGRKQHLPVRWYAGYSR